MSWGHFQGGRNHLSPPPPRPGSDLLCGGVGGPGQGAGKGQGKGTGGAAGARGSERAPPQSTPPPRPAPAARPFRAQFTCRCAPSSMAPLPLLGPSSPPLRFRKPRPPPPGLSYLKLPGKSRRRRGIRRPLPSSAGPGGSRGPAPPLGYAGSSPSADPEAPDPTSPRNVEPRAPHLRPRFPLPCDTGPHPGIQGQKWTFPASGVLQSPPGRCSQRGRPRCGQRRLPASGQGLWGRSAPGRVSLVSLGTPLRPGSRPKESLLLSHVVGVKWANIIPVAP